MPHRTVFTLVLLALIAVVINIGCERAQDVDQIVTPEPELTETLIIGPYRTDCVGAFPQECYLVLNEDDQTWEFFYESIEGFDYEPGFTYTVKVSLHDRGEGIQDVGRYAYKLVEVVSREETPVEE